MAKILVPAYVASALNADRTQQLNTLSALIAYVFAEEKAERTVDKLGETLHKQAPHRSVKTWQNYVSAVNAVVTNQGPKLESLFTEHQAGADMVTPLQQWLVSELTKKRYNSSAEDVANWAKGKPSIAAAARAKEKADRDALREQAKIDAAAPPPKTQAELDAIAAATKKAEAEAADRAAEAAKPAAEARAAEGAARSEEAEAIRTAITALTGYPQAITPQEPGPVFMASLARNPDGTVHMTLAEGLTRADVVSMALALELLLDSPAYATAEAEETAEA